MKADTGAGGPGEPDRLLTFAQAAASLPPSRRGGRPVHSSTISRWRCPGVRRRDGSCITLQCLRLPSGWMTTRRWLDEFFETLTAEKTGRPVPTVEIRTPARRRRDVERANRELDAIGIV